MGPDGKGEESDLGVEGGKIVIRIQCEGKNLLSIRGEKGIFRGKLSVLSMFKIPPL